MIIVPEDLKIASDVPRRTMKRDLIVVCKRILLCKENRSISIINTPSDPYSQIAQICMFKKRLDACNISTSNSDRST